MFGGQPIVFNNYDALRKPQFNKDFFVIHNTLQISQGTADLFLK